MVKLLSRLRAVSGLTLPVFTSDATPASGEMALFAKADGFLYKKDSAGVETIVAGVTPGSDAPVGAYFPFAGSTAPPGFMIADGTAISRTIYSELYNLIGTTYGVGDGSTTFNLPNLKGRVIVGRDASQTEFDVLGETGGAKTHTLQISEMPSHQHTQALGGSISTVANVSGTYVVGNANNSLTTATGGGGAHNNLQPYIVGNYIIKVSTIIGGQVPNQLLEMSVSPHTATTGWSKVPLALVNSRTGSNMTFTSNGVTINTAGWYRIDANVLWDGGTTGRRVVRVIGAASSGAAASGLPSLASEDVVAGATTWFPAMAPSITRFIAAGTHIRLEVYQDTGGTLSNINSHMSIEALSGNPADAANSGWIYPTLINGWVNFAGGHQAARYCKINGVVFVEGLIKSGTLGSAAFVLPAGYRPNDTLMHGSVDGSNTADGRCDFIGGSGANLGQVVPTTGNTGFFDINFSFVASQ